MSDTVEQQLCNDASFRLGESLERICKCLDLLSPDEIWQRPNAETTSIGNLALHLCGNVRQWIISGLGGEPDNRTRSEEFAEQGHLPTAEIAAKLRQTVEEAQTVITRLDHASLPQPRTVQGNTETGVEILVHVVEHFSYHTGEITYATKSLKAVDMKYYEGQDLDVTS